MKAIIIKKFGGPEELVLTNIPIPQPGPEQVLVRVYATALNRADILQRKGKYLPPKGEPDVLGLEIAGEVEAWGDKVRGFTKGQKVFGLVGGGGYAEYCLIDHKMAMTIPDSLTLEEAAAIPEAFFTANEALFELGGLAAGESILIHAGGSGVGTAAIQLASYSGATVYFSAGSDQKIAKGLTLGAAFGINYKKDDFSARLAELTSEIGVDIVMDFLGAEYFDKNLQVLKQGGRFLSLAFMTGANCQLNLAHLVTNYLQIKGFILRHRTLEEKRAITQRFYKSWILPLITKKIKPIIDSVFKLDEVAEAHRKMESNLNFGKIVLKM